MKDKLPEQGKSQDQETTKEDKKQEENPIWTRGDLIVKRNQLEDYEIQLIDLNRGIEGTNLAVKQLEEHPKLALRKLKLDLKQYELRKQITEKNIGIIKNQIIKINRNFKEEK